MNEEEARSLEGRIFENEEWLYELIETSNKGVWTAENKAGKTGYVRHPNNYEAVGMDGEFRIAYKNISEESR